MKNKLSIILLLSILLPLNAGKTKKPTEGGRDGYRVSPRRELQISHEKIIEFEKTILPPHEKVLESIDYKEYAVGFQLVKDTAPSYRYEALEFIATNFIALVSLEKSEEKYKDILPQVREAINDIREYKAWKANVERLSGGSSRGVLGEIDKEIFTAFEFTMNTKFLQRVAEVRKE